MTDPPQPPQAWVPPVAQPVPPPVMTPLLAPPPPGPSNPNPYAPTPPRPSSGGPSTLVIVLIVVGVLVALIVGLVFLFGSLINSIGSSSPYDPPVSQPDPVFTPRESTAPPPTAPVGGPDQTLTTEHGVSITVEKPSCVSYADGQGGASHRRCSVPVDVANDGLEQIKLSSIDFGLYIGETRYAPNSEDSLFFGVPRSSRLDPANGGLVLLWFDVPVDGAEPTSLEFQRYGVVDTALTVEFSQPSAGAQPAPPVFTGAPLGSTLQALPTFNNEMGYLEITMHTVECGLTEAPSDEGTLRPDGQFCKVTATVGNQTAGAQKVSGADFTLIVDGKRVTTSSPANRFDGQRRSDFMESGEADECILWFDVPVGAVPTGVSYFTYGGSPADFTVP